MIKVLLNGATGRMGQAILLAAADSNDVRIIAGIAGSAHDPQELGGVPLLADLTDCDQSFDVLIDFSTPEGQAQAVGFCLERQRPLVSGTTGLSDAQQQALMGTDWEIPVVFAPNMSPGVAVMRALVVQAATLLGTEADVEISETHHRHKIDSPSGTALSLGEAVAKARDQVLSEVSEHGRLGRVGPRHAGTIGFHARRGGDVVGDHQAAFFTAGECLTVEHHSSSRRGFAEGALRAARWVIDQPAGAYGMDDVLGLN